MRFVIKSFFLLLLLVLGGAVALLFVAIEQEDLVKEDKPLTHQDIARAKQILDQNDPRRLQPGAVKTMTLSRQDLELVANYLGNRLRLLPSASKVILTSGGAVLQTTLRLPANPLGSAVNITLGLARGEPLPHLQQLRLGQLALPPDLVNRALEFAIQNSAWGNDLNFATSTIKNLTVDPDQVRITYEWDPDVVARLRSRFLAGADQEALQTYYEYIARLSHRVDTDKVSLAHFISPLFELALTRSRDSDALLENRALILALTAYVNGHTLARLVPDAQQTTAPNRLKVTLRGRVDLARHFMLSAALAVTGGNVLSDAIGLFKEVDDARAGSGFSFTDLAADRAGSRFGELATASLETADRLQQRAAAGMREAAFMPAISDLLEFMPEAEFKTRFGGTDQPAYQQMVATIDGRIDACALYR